MGDRASRCCCEVATPGMWDVWGGERSPFAIGYDSLIIETRLGDETLVPDTLTGLDDLKDFVSPKGQDLSEYRGLLQRVSVLPGIGYPESLSSSAGYEANPSLPLPTGFLTHDFDADGKPAFEDRGWWISRILNTSAGGEEHVLCFAYRWIDVTPDEPDPDAKAWARDHAYIWAKTDAVGGLVHLGSLVFDFADDAVGNTSNYTDPWIWPLDDDSAPQITYLGNGVLSRFGRTIDLKTAPTTSPLQQNGETFGNGWSVSTYRQTRSSTVPSESSSYVSESAAIDWLRNSEHLFWPERYASHSSAGACLGVEITASYLAYDARRGQFGNRLWIATAKADQAGYYYGTAGPDPAKGSAAITWGAIGPTVSYSEPPDASGNRGVSGDVTWWLGTTAYQHCYGGGLHAAIFEQRMELRAQGITDNPPSIFDPTRYDTYHDVVAVGKDPVVVENRNHNGSPDKTTFFAGGSTPDVEVDTPLHPFESERRVFKIGTTTVHDTGLREEGWQQFAISIPDDGSCCYAIESWVDALASREVKLQAGSPPPRFITLSTASGATVSHTADEGYAAVFVCEEPIALIQGAANGTVQQGTLGAWHYIAINRDATVSGATTYEVETVSGNPARLMQMRSVWNANDFGDFNGPCAISLTPPTVSSGKNRVLAFGAFDTATGWDALGGYGTGAIAAAGEQDDMVAVAVWNTAADASINWANAEGVLLGTFYLQLTGKDINLGDNPTPDDSHSIVENVPIGFGTPEGQYRDVAIAALQNRIVKYLPDGSIAWSMVGGLQYTLGVAKDSLAPIDSNPQGLWADILLDTAYDAAIVDPIWRKHKSGFGLLAPGTGYAVAIASETGRPTLLGPRYDGQYGLSLGERAVVRVIDNAASTLAT